MGGGGIDKIFARWGDSHPPGKILHLYMPLRIWSNPKKGMHMGSVKKVQILCGSDHLVFFKFHQLMACMVKINIKEYYMKYK